MNRLLSVCSLICIVFLMSVAAASAQEASLPNNPATNPNANACLPGGSWAGRCDNYDADRNGTIDQNDRNYMYRCGWYQIRAERGLISSVPSDCPKVCPGYRIVKYPFLFPLTAEFVDTYFWVLGNVSENNLATFFTRDYTFDFNTSGEFTFTEDFRDKTGCIFVQFRSN